MMLITLCVRIISIHAIVEQQKIWKNVVTSNLGLPYQKLTKSQYLNNYFKK
jgi:hypothetical protein